MRTRERDRIDREIKEETKAESSAKMKTTGPETRKRIGIIVKSIHVKVRQEPNFESEVLGILRKGDTVEILGKEKSFYKVSTNENKNVYISSDFIKEV